MEDNGYRYNWGEFPKEVRTLLFGVNRGVSYNIAVQPEQIDRFFHAPIGQKYRRRYGMGNLLGFEEDLAMYLQKIDVGYSRMQGGKRSDELRKKNANCDGLDMGTVEYLLRQRYIFAEDKKKMRVQNALFSTLSKAINIGDKKELQENSKLPNDFHEQLKNKRIKLSNSIKDLQENDLQKELVSILSNENVEETIQKCKVNGQTRDIVMIDEPELSLNGKWKRSILDDLQKLLPNTQIIVATHSSTVAEKKFNALVKLK